MLNLGEPLRVGPVVASGKGVVVVSSGVRVLVRRSERGPLVQVSEFDLRRSPDSLAHLQPVRDVVNAKSWGRPSWQPVFSLGLSVATESRIEAFRLLELDFYRELRWLVAQPLRVEVLESRLTLYPDFLYGRPDGLVVLESVRLVEGRDADFERGSEVLSRIAAACGWTFRIAGDAVDEFGPLLDHLAQYARVAPREDVVEGVVAAFGQQDEWSFGELVSRCAGSDPVALASIYSLLWKRVLVFSLLGGLSSSTVMRLNEQV